MVIFWKIRYLDRTAREFKDRYLYVDTTALDPVPKAAIELGLEANSQSDQRILLRYRLLFEQRDPSGSEQDDARKPVANFRCFGISDYFEDENGQEISDTEMGRVITGNPNIVVIPRGARKHDIELMQSAQTPIDFSSIQLTENELKTLGYFARDWKQLVSSAFMKHGPGRISVTGSFATGTPTLTTAVTEEEIRSFVLVFRRLYMVEDRGTFTKAIKLVGKVVRDYPIGKWIAAEGKIYHKRLDHPFSMVPFVLPGKCNFSSKRLLDVFIYTHYAHQPDAEREEQFADCLAQLDGKKDFLTWLFLSELQQMSSHFANAGSQIVRIMDAYCKHHNVTPDVLRSLLDEHPGIGTLERDADRKARLFEEKARQLAEDLWKYAGKPAGGSVLFLESARAQLRKAMEKSE